jgi:hypothetical protein
MPLKNIREENIKKELKKYRLTFRIKVQISIKPNSGQIDKSTNLNNEKRFLKSVFPISFSERTTPYKCEYIYLKDLFSLLRFVDLTRIRLDQYLDVTLIH